MSTPTKNTFSHVWEYFLMWIMTSAGFFGQFFFYVGVPLTMANGKMKINLIWNKPKKNEADFFKASYVEWFAQIVLNIQFCDVSDFMWKIFTFISTDFFGTSFLSREFQFMVWLSPLSHCPLKYEMIKKEPFSSQHKKLFKNE